MSNRFFSPNQQFADATGLPYAAGTLAFYASGTSTPLATYSDSALSVANTNPVVLDSAGRAGNIFLQNLAYKVVLSDVNSNVIWTDDPVYSSDYSSRAKLLSGAGSPNGTTAGTQGSTGIGADVYWDTTNNILYVCTQTGTTSTAVWTAVNAATAAAVVPPPQGYLTLTSGTPVIAADVTGATTVYYTPFIGNTVPIYNGTTFSTTVFSELQLALTNQTVSTVYDVFAFNNVGVITLAVGPAWSTSTAGSGARGTGAGTTQLSRLNGLWVNTVSMSAKNASTTYTIAANQGTFLGSILIDVTPGQVSCYNTWGTGRKWGVSNAYNRVPVIVKSGALGGNYNYTTNAWRVSAANTGSAITTLSCLAEERYDSTFIQQTGAVTVSAGTAVNLATGIGLNSTSSPTGPYVSATFTNSNASGITLTLPGLVSQYQSVPLLGVQVFNPLENGLGSTATNSILAGSEPVSTISVRWRA